jgi:hypothetical protein
LISSTNRSTSARIGSLICGTCRHFLLFRFHA